MMAISYKAFLSVSALVVFVVPLLTFGIGCGGERSLWCLHLAMIPQFASRSFLIVSPFACRYMTLLGSLLIHMHKLSAVFAMVQQMKVFFSCAIFVTRLGILTVWDSDSPYLRVIGIAEIVLFYRMNKMTVK